MTAKHPPTDIDVLATAAAGAIAQAKETGTFSQYSFDDATEMAYCASMRPDILGHLMGDKDGAFSQVPPGVLAFQILDDYTNDVLLKERMDAMEEAKAEEKRYALERQTAVEAYTRLGPEELARLDFDKSQGDTSPLLAIEEKFYFG